MKKLLSILAITGGAMFLAACGGEEETKVELECEANEVEVDGECIANDTAPTYEEAELTYGAISKGDDDSTYNPNWGSGDGFKDNMSAIETLLNSNLNGNEYVNTLGSNANDAITGATATDSFQYYEVSQTAALRLMTNATIDTTNNFEAYAFTHDKNISKATFENGELAIQEYFTPSYFTAGNGLVDGVTINAIAIGDNFFQLNDEGQYMLVEINDEGEIAAAGSKQDEIYQWIRRDENFMKEYVDAIESDTLLVGSDITISGTSLSLTNESSAVSTTTFMTSDDLSNDVYGTVSKAACSTNTLSGNTLAKFCTNYMGGTWTETIGSYITNIESKITSDSIDFNEIFEMTGAELTAGGGTDTDSGVSAGLADKDQYIEVMLRAIARSITGDIEFDTDGTAKAYNYTHGGYITEAIATVESGTLSVAYDEFFLPNANLLDFTDVTSVKIGTGDNEVEYTAEEFQAAASTVGSNQASFILTEDAMEKYVTAIKEGIFVITE